MYYCQHCGVLIDASSCPFCGNKSVREPRKNDFCFVVEKEAIWAGLFSDVLSQNEIPFITKRALGAGFSMKVGPMLERFRFYVPYGYYERAKELEEDTFPAGMEEAEPKQ